MSKWKLVLFSCVVSLGGTLAHADSNVCTINYGAPVSCNQTPFTSVGDPILSAGFSGNTFGAETGIGLNPISGYDPSTAYQQRVAYDDTYNLPLSPVGDVLKINLQIVGIYGSASIAIDSQNSPSASIFFQTDADILGCEYHVCSYTGTIQADLYSTVKISGAASQDTAFYQDGAESYVDLSIQRFASDGTTPDNYTPEPATWGLMAISLAAAGFGKRWMKR